MGRKAHIPDPAMRRQVETMAAYGIPETDISRVVNIDPKTLRKHYRDELDLGETKANAQVAGFLFNSAKNGNVSAQIFWLKTRARWRETPMELKHSGAIAHKDLSQLTDEELIAMIGALSIDVRATPMKTIEGSASLQPPECEGPIHAKTTDGTS
jgi:hypothetical protein